MKETLQERQVHRDLFKRLCNARKTKDEINGRQGRPCCKQERNIKEKRQVHLTTINKKSAHSR
jgi:hypothetical protein